jgi:integrase
LEENVPRPKKDGAKAAPPRKQNFTELFVSRVRPEAAPFNAWDTKQPGLVLRVQPTGHRAFKVVYSFRGRPRWWHVGDVGRVGLSDARRMAKRVLLDVAEGKDPVAERKAERGAGTFAELAEQYVNEHAKKKNRSWRQADYLIRKHLLPRWGKLEVKSISRADVRAAIAKIGALVLANQTLAAASAIFSWGVKQEILTVNPVKGVERHDTKSRERVLSDTEVAKFWNGFDDAGLVRGSALKLILLTGQRPGEVAHMRREHIKDGWWELPGKPNPNVGWPGTKNDETHRVWLSEPARAVLREFDDDNAATGFVFASARGRPVNGLDSTMRDVCQKLNAERATPHDLRRTFSTAVTRLGFGRDAMNRVTNHKEGGIANVYDRYEYESENRRVMDAVANHIVALAEGRTVDNVVPLRQA